MDDRFWRAADLLLRQRELAERTAEVSKTLPKVHIGALGHVAGLNDGLAAMAGAAGFWSREQFEVQVRERREGYRRAAEAAATHSQHNDDPTDADPIRPGRYCGPQCDLYRAPDTEPVPMGGWEPRS